MRYIEDLREEMMVNDVYFCRKKQELLTKAGKTYYSLILQDKTGSLDGKVWNVTSGGIDEFSSLDYIHVQGRVTSFQGSLQLNIERVRKCGEGEYDEADYMPCSKKNVGEMYQELVSFVQSVKEPHLQQLLKQFFVEDGDFKKKFSAHSAAKSVHHGFIGGLLEHTLAVTKMCDFFAKTYPIINRDLLVTAAMFHDMGKLTELSGFPENDYTDAGQLLGHIYIGAHLVENACDNIADFPPTLKRELIHCILAHHGELEYGSPKKPAIVEAFALNFADNVDAKFETLLELMSGGEESNLEWLGFQRTLDTNIRRTSRRD
ncbi:MAG: HD domain-containing protein [Lachnospiraceae bacterium]|nr:HD domain-containing protein [Lachnospiraceae bacterium]MCR4801800.1 HD domain-containing protein [Lachnospiraceae bacterium]